MSINLEEAGNYRGIAPSTIADKITNKINLILNRIQPHLDPNLHPNQNGFRNRITTPLHILALRQLIEGVNGNNIISIIVFIDFKKAFDSINRKVMLTILQAYRLPDIIIQAITLTYKDTFAKIKKIHDGEINNDTLVMKMSYTFLFMKRIVI